MSSSSSSSSSPKDKDSSLVSNLDSNKLLIGELLADDAVVTTMACGRPLSNEEQRKGGQWHRAGFELSSY